MENNTIYIGKGNSYYDISANDIVNGFNEFTKKANRRELKKLKTNVSFKLKFDLQKA